jgi:histidyl-tRNA synthetase
LVLRAIDKLDKFPAGEVAKLLGSGRWDGGEAGKGDFTPGANLSPEQIDIVFGVVGGHSESWVRIDSNQVPPTDDEHTISAEDLKAVLADEKLVAEHDFKGSYYFSNVGVIGTWQERLQQSQTGLRGLNELRSIVEIAESAGYGSRRIRIASEVVRGLEYYTGPVFEVELTFETPGDDGKPVRFGSVAGGGRYDGLVGRFRGDDVPATGISIGVSRLMAALQHLKKIDTKPEAGPVVVTVFPDVDIAQYQRFVSSLRNAGIRAELYLGQGKFGAQMKYADRRGSPCAVIQGGDEKQKGEVQIKDLILGATIASIKDRDEYKAAQAKAQYAVPEDQLVEEVRKLLAKHGVKWE